MLLQWETSRTHGGSRKIKWETPANAGGDREREFPAKHARLACILQEQR